MDTPCPLCSSPNSTEAWSKPAREADGRLRSVVIRDSAGRIVHGRVVVCHRCGLCYTTPRMTDAELAEFYRARYRRIYPTTLEAEDRHARRAYDIVRPLRDEPGRFLDVGCSSGLLAERLIHLHDAYGLEPGYAGDNPRIIASTLEAFTPEVRYDLVTMLNTLEHVPSPVDALRRLRGLLAPGGRLLVSVPDLWTRLVNIPTDAFLSCAHLFHFTEATARACFGVAGLRVLDVQRHDEEIGEKLYILAEAGEPQPPPTQPSVTPGEVRQHLTMMDRVYDAKVGIRGAGYR